MAFEDNLPVGSTPFSNTLYKDPSDRIWTGNPFQSEFYRFLDRSEVEFIYVNIKDFGAVGDGVTDDTEAFENALDEAKSSGNYLYFPDGTYPVTVSADTVEMDGCLGLMGKGELLFTSTGNPDRPLLRWNGQKELVASEVAVTEGQNTFTIDTGKSINRGDTVFVISNENMISDATVRYVKGERLTANTYNPSTGELTTYEYAYYSITDAYFYHNTVRPRVQLQDVTIRLTGDQDKKGIQVDCGQLYVDSVTINGFGRFGICVSSSMGRISRAVVTMHNEISTTTGYGVQSAGLSDVIIDGSLLYGLRHGLSCGDVGYWRGTDVGDADASIYAPSICKASGCRIEGTEYAAESHLGTTLLDMYNCDIYGSVQFGGRETYISTSRIYESDTTPATLRFGRDRPAGSGVGFGRYAVRDCSLYPRRRLININTNCEYIELSKCVVRPSADETAREFINYISNSQPGQLKLTNITHVGNVGDNVIYLFYVSRDIVISGIDFTNAGMNFSIRNNTVRLISLTDISIRNPSGIGVNVTSQVEAIGLFSIKINQCNITGCSDGIKVARAGAVAITSGNITGNGVGIVVNKSHASIGTVPIVLSSLTFNNTNNDISIENAQVLAMSLIGNVFENPQIGVNDSDIVGKYGNIGIEESYQFTLDFGGPIPSGAPVLQTISVPGAVVGDSLLINKINVGSSADSNLVMTAMVLDNTGFTQIFGINAGTSTITVNEINVVVKLFKHQ